MWAVARVRGAHGIISSCTVEVYPASRKGATQANIQRHVARIHMGVQFTVFITPVAHCEGVDVRKVALAQQSESLSGPFTFLLKRSMPSTPETPLGGSSKDRLGCALPQDLSTSGFFNRCKRNHVVLQETEVVHTTHSIPHFPYDIGL